MDQTHASPNHVGMTCSHRDKTVSFLSRNHGRYFSSDIAAPPHRNPDSLNFRVRQLTVWKSFLSRQLTRGKPPRVPLSYPSTPIGPTTGCCATPFSWGFDQISPQPKCGGNRSSPTLSTKKAPHNSRTKVRPRSLMTDFAVCGGFEGHGRGLPITSSCLSSRMASLAGIAHNLGESRRRRARRGHRRRPGNGARHDGAARERAVFAHPAGPCASARILRRASRIVASASAPPPRRMISWRACATTRPGRPIRW